MRLPANLTINNWQQIPGSGIVKCSGYLRKTLLDDSSAAWLKNNSCLETAYQENPSKKLFEQYDEENGNLAIT
jgi:hypothetical protein